MKLYGYWRSSSSWRVRIALAHKEIEYESVPIDLSPGQSEQQGSAFEGENPMRQVPLLVTDEGVRIAQSVAILEYLEECYPTPALLPQGANARAVVRELVEIVNSGIQPLQNIKVLGEVKEIGGDAAEWSRRVMIRGLAALETRAKQTAGKHLVGDQITMADLCLVPQLYNARRFDVEVERYPGLLNAEKASESVPAFRSAHPDEQSDAVKTS